MADRRAPLTIDTEKQTLLDFLDYLRESIVIKASGLDEETVRRALVASGTSLLGLVKHLTYVEWGWFQWSFLGTDDPAPNGDLAPGDTAESVIADYRAVIKRSNEIVTDCDDLEQRCARAATHLEPLPLRWVLVHMVEETARHAGHGDIIREQLDGQTGR